MPVHSLGPEFPLLLQGQLGVRSAERSMDSREVSHLAESQVVQESARHLELAAELWEEPSAAGTVANLAGASALERRPGL